eukprot:749858-Hanusia_phi.AAC.10
MEPNQLHQFNSHRRCHWTNLIFQWNLFSKPYSITFTSPSFPHPHQDHPTRPCPCPCPCPCPRPRTRPRPRPRPRPLPHVAVSSTPIPNHASNPHPYILPDPQNSMLPPHLDRVFSGPYPGSQYFGTPTSEKATPG